MIELRVLGVVELLGASRADLDAVLAQPKRVALLHVPRPQSRGRLHQT